MIGVKVAINTALLDGLEQFIDGTVPRVEQIGRDSGDRARFETLKRLGAEPRAAVHPFEFATPKSRRYYFFAVREGLIPTNGQRYVRTGSLSGGWEVEADTRGGTFAQRIFNPAPSARYVYGTAVRNLGVARRAQVAGHRRTGWPLASEELTQIERVVTQDFRERYDREIGLEFARLNQRRRAFSR